METEFSALKIPNQLGVDACSRKLLRGTREAYAVKQLDEFAHKTGALCDAHSASRLGGSVGNLETSRHVETQV